MLYCSTCQRKSRYLNQGLLRFFGRIEWLFNIYTSCASCGFTYVTKVSSRDGSSESQSRWNKALQLPTYTCDRCETSYSDIRPSRRGAQPKPEAVQPRRVIRIRVPEAVHLPGSAEAAGLTELASGASRVLALPPGQSSFARADLDADTTAAAMRAAWDAAPVVTVPLVIDIAPGATPARTVIGDIRVDDRLRALTSGHGTIDLPAADQTTIDHASIDDARAGQVGAAMANGVPAESTLDLPADTFHPLDEAWAMLDAQSAAAPPAEAPPAPAIASSLPSLDVTYAAPPFDEAAADGTFAAVPLDVPVLEVAALDIVQTMPAGDEVHAAPVVEVVPTIPSLDVIHAAAALEAVEAVPTLDMIHTVPSLDKVHEMPALEVARSAELTAAKMEKAARATAERARLEMLLAAFERHAANRRRIQAAQLARAPQFASSKPFTPQTSASQSAPRVPAPLAN